MEKDKVLARIKELETEIMELMKQKELIAQKVQEFQKTVAQINTNILKYQGGIEELRKSIA